jgi:hypothetical protein
MLAVGSLFRPLLRPVLFSVAPSPRRGRKNSQRDYQVIVNTSRAWYGCRDAPVLISYRVYSGSNSSLKQGWCFWRLPSKR